MPNLKELLQKHMSFQSNFSFNHIYIIQSLRKGDLKCAESLYYDCLKRLAMVKPFKIDFFDVRSKYQFNEKMALIYYETICGHKPFIHLDMHGDEKGGLQINPSLEYVSWAEFRFKCQQINKVSFNNLSIVLASCFGFYSILEIDIREVSPCYMLIGCDAEVSAGFINDYFPEFYENLLTTNNVNIAFDYIKMYYKMYVSEQILAIAFAEYLYEYCKGKGRKNRIEKLITEYRKTHTNSVFDLTTIRKYFKNATKPDLNEFGMHFNRFLMGNHRSNVNRFDFPYKTVLEIV